MRGTEARSHRREQKPTGAGKLRDLLLPLLLSPHFRRLVLRCRHLKTATPDEEGHIIERSPLDFRFVVRRVPETAPSHFSTRTRFAICALLYREDRLSSELWSTYVTL